MRNGSAASISSSAAVSSSSRAMAMFSMAEWRSDTYGSKAPGKNAPRALDPYATPTDQRPRSKPCKPESLGRRFPGAAHIFQPNHLVRLRSLGTLNNVKFHLVDWKSTRLNSSHLGI